MTVNVDSRFIKWKQRSVYFYLLWYTWLLNSNGPCRTSQEFSGSGYGTATSWYSISILFRRVAPGSLCVSGRHSWNWSLSLHLLFHLAPSSMHTMQSLDQGHLHPLQENQRQTCLGRESNPDVCVAGVHSSKELFEQLIYTIGIRNFVHSTTVSFYGAVVRHRVLGYPE